MVACKFSVVIRKLQAQFLNFLGGPIDSEKIPGARAAVVIAVWTVSDAERPIFRDFSVVRQVIGEKIQTV